MTAQTRSSDNVKVSDLVPGLDGIMAFSISNMAVFAERTQNRESMKVYKDFNDSTVTY